LDERANRQTTGRSQKVGEEKLSRLAKASRFTSPLHLAPREIIRWLRADIFSPASCRQSLDFLRKPYAKSKSGILDTVLHSSSICFNVALNTA